MDCLPLWKLFAYNQRYQHLDVWTVLVQLEQVQTWQSLLLSY